MRVVLKGYNSAAPTVGPMVLLKVENSVDELADDWVVTKATLKAVQTVDLMVAN